MKNLFFPKTDYIPRKRRPTVDVLSDTLDSDDVGIQLSILFTVPPVVQVLLFSPFIVDSVWRTTSIYFKVGVYMPSWIGRHPCLNKREMADNSVFIFSNRVFFPVDMISYLNFRLSTSTLFSILIRIKLICWTKSAERYDVMR